MDAGDLCQPLRRVEIGSVRLEPGAVIMGGKTLQEGSGCRGSLD